MSTEHISPDPVSPDDDDGPQLLEVPVSSSGVRVDAYVAQLLPDFSRSRITALVKKGHILVDDDQVKPAKKLVGGEVIAVDIPPASPSDTEAQDLPLDVLYEDDHLLVLNKAAGMVVHPGAGHRDGTVLNALLHHVPALQMAQEARPGIVHRLDKDTSGVMVCAKDDKTHRLLSAAFAARDVDKRYRAFTLGVPKEEAFERITGHKRDRVHRMRFSTRCDPPSEDDGVKSDNRLAHSTFKRVQFALGFCELEVQLHTGRTHQIRAHLADIGCPIVQDELYGGLVDKRGKGFAPSQAKRAGGLLKRQALHAEALAFVHPHTHEDMRFAAPLPDDLLRLQEALRQTVLDDSGA